MRNQIKGILFSLILFVSCVFAQEVFLKQTKTVPAHMEWSREIVCKKQSMMQFKVSSPERFGVTLVTDRAYKAIQLRDKDGIKREDVLLTEDCQDPVYEKTLSLEPGSYHFILENQSAIDVEMHLECAEVEN